MGRVSDEHDTSAEAAAPAGADEGRADEAAGTADSGPADSGTARRARALNVADATPEAGSAGESAIAETAEAGPKGAAAESEEPEAASESGTGSGSGAEPHEDAEPDEDAGTGEGVAADAEAAPDPELPESVAIRVNRTSLLVPLAIAACATPVATLAGGPAPLVYLIPIVLAAWIVRSETVVDTGGLTVRTLLRTRRIAWERLRSLRLRENGWISAVLDSEQQVRLSGVRMRDVPKLALMSGGRLPNPERQE